MEIISVRKGRTIKVVTIANVGEANDEAVFDAACKAAGEVWRGEGRTVFDISAAYFDEEDLGLTAVVSICTD